MPPKKLEKEGRVGKAITNGKKREIVEKCEIGVCVTHLTNMYNMLKFTISMLFQRKDLRKASVAEGSTQISHDQLY